MTLPKDPIKAQAFKEKMRMIRTGTKHTEETKRKMSESRSGEKNPNYGGNPELAERCRELAKARIGKNASEETKQRMSESHKKYYSEHPEAIEFRRERMIGENNPNFGKPISDEQKIKLSLAKQGENHPNFGKHLPESTIEKIRAANSGENCYHYGQSPSDETRKRMSEALKGDKCYNWKGGITELNHAIRTCLQNRDWIQAVFKRDNFTCQRCKATKVYLHAHHIKHFADIMREHNIKTIEDAVTCKELWDINNGMALCEDCHNAEHYGNDEE